MKKEYPIAKIIEKKIEKHNDIRIDNYYWLNDIDNPDTMNYINQENEYSRLFFQSVKNLSNEIYDEIVSRIAENDYSLPVNIVNDYIYYIKKSKGKQYKIHYRKRCASKRNKEEIILDENELAKDFRYFNLSTIKPSPDNKFLAFSVDTNGSLNYTIFLKDLDKNNIISDKIENVVYNFEWSEDSKTLFYITKDNLERPFCIHSHCIGSNVKDDAILFTENNDSFDVSIYKTNDNKYLMINTKSKITNEIYYMNICNEIYSPKLIKSKENGVKYKVEHYGNRFYVLTNEDSSINNKIIAYNDENSSEKRIKTLIQHKKNILLEDIEIFDKFLVVYLRKNGLKRIRVLNLTTNKKHYINIHKDKTFAYYKGKNFNHDSNVLRIHYTSPIFPIATFDYNMKTKKYKLIKQEKVKGYNPNNYKCERVFATSNDGVKIPISLVYRKDLFKKDGTNPLYLFGYGAYGYSFEPDFISMKLSLMNRGVICAIAHIRGGIEMGNEWYYSGKILKKQNTFNDFIFCTEYLINNKYTNSNKIAIHGMSAGGLLIGVAINQRPDLFKVALAECPFVDVLTTMLDETLPLTIKEYEEWGNPNEEIFYNYIKSYSPYDNIKKRSYPNLLITIGLNDPLVKYWEPLKWAAKLREYKENNSILLLKIDTDSSHSGKSGYYNIYKDISEKYSFILSHIFK